MSTDLVTVAVLDNPEHAALARNVLDAAGIPSFIADENMVGMAWHMAGALGGVKVQVSAEDEEDARALLEKDIELQIETGRKLGTEERKSAIVAGRRPFSSSEKTDAIAAEMPHRTSAKSDDDDAEEPTPTIREKNATASLRMAVLGLIFAPILLLAAYMLFQVIGTEERLEGKARRHAWITAAILGGVVLLIMMLISIPTHVP